MYTPYAGPGVGVAAHNGGTGPELAGDSCDIGDFGFDGSDIVFREGTVRARPAGAATVDAGRGIDDQEVRA